MFCSRDAEVQTQNQRRLRHNQLRVFIPQETLDTIREHIAANIGMSVVRMLDVAESEGDIAIRMTLDGAVHGPFVGVSASAVAAIAESLDEHDLQLSSLRIASISNRNPVTDNARAIIWWTWDLEAGTFSYSDPDNDYEYMRNGYTIDDIRAYFGTQ